MIHSGFAAITSGLLVLAACSSHQERWSSIPASADMSSIDRAPAAMSNSVSWSLGVFLPENVDKKVYLNIEQGRIKSITSSPANDSVIEMNAIAFPGLIDMHGHIKYNTLPLWENALGQFTNRHEWRGKYSPYGAVSFNMKAYTQTVCANVRWAELKALVGGATSMQGIGNDGSCTQDFGIHNVEIANEYGRKANARGATDVIMPALVGSVFLKRMAPYMNKGDSYEVAYNRMLDDTGVTKWVGEFKSLPHTVANGVKLMTGLSVVAPLTAPATPELEFAGYAEQLKIYLAQAPYKLTDAGKVQKQLDAMKVFILGQLDKVTAKYSGGFVLAKADDKTALNFLTKGGVLNFDGGIRRYIGMFEGARESWLASLVGPNKQPIVAHIAEGQPKDPYNQLEYLYLKQFGLNKHGMVMIHAVGLDKKDFEDAKINNISVVWSPFSNLLLYGETMDIAAAKAAGLNIAIGSDWTPTGSKNILDELKIAKRYLKKMGITGITDKDLVDMATINGARALALEDRLGLVKENYIADLTLLSKANLNKQGAVDPYASLVAASAADIALVVVEGQPLYGEPAAIESAAKIFKDQKSPELLPVSRTGACNFQKGLRLPAVGKYPDWATYKDLEATLLTANKEFGAKAASDKTLKSSLKYLAPLDPVFACEDARYTQRVAQFIEVELEKNNANRAKERAGNAALGKPALPLSYNPLGDDPRENLESDGNAEQPQK